MSIDVHGNPILVLDFGSQYTQLIARRIRALEVYCEILPCDCPPERIRDSGAAGIILSGGPESAGLEGASRIPEAACELGVPILGICYGMQIMAEQFGGKALHRGKHEFGFAKAFLREPGELLQGIVDGHEDGVDHLKVWMSHGDQVVELPTGFRTLAVDDGGGIAAMGDLERRWYGIQFHPEVTHTAQGERILERFVCEICGCQRLWKTSDIITEIIDKIRADVGSEAVLLGLSGGVDSSVTAALAHSAIGDQLTCIFVDNGLLRLGEADQVMDAFADVSDNVFQLRVIRVDASDEFLERLQGVEDPEEKRRVIGRTFIDVFERQARQFGDAKWLAQGTIYPDVIESAGHAGGKAHVIKSHHNVGGLPERMKLRLLEPLRELFKDEVRRVGLQLGLPLDLIRRHPFPGPGLGVRVLGEVRPEYLDTLRQADAIFLEELVAAGLYHEVSQAFAVFLPVKTVGVTGDSRRYEPVIALRAVETVDFMTARWVHLPHELLGRVANRVVNELPRVSRVVYDVTSKPPGTIEWE